MTTKKNDRCKLGISRRALAGIARVCGPETEGGFIPITDEVGEVDLKDPCRVQNVHKTCLYEYPEPVHVLAGKYDSSKMPISYVEKYDNEVLYKTDKNGTVYVLGTFAYELDITETRFNKMLNRLPKAPFDPAFSQDTASDSKSKSRGQSSGQDVNRPPDLKSKIGTSQRGEGSERGLSSMRGSVAGQGLLTGGLPFEGTDDTKKVIEKHEKLKSTKEFWEALPSSRKAADRVYFRRKFYIDKSPLVFCTEESLKRLFIPTEIKQRKTQTLKQVMDHTFDETVDEDSNEEDSSDEEDSDYAPSSGDECSNTLELNPNSIGTRQQGRLLFIEPESQIRYPLNPIVKLAVYYSEENITNKEICFVFPKYIYADRKYFEFIVNILEAFNCIDQGSIYEELTVQYNIACEEGKASTEDMIYSDFDMGPYLNMYTVLCTQQPLEEEIRGIVTQHFGSSREYSIRCLFNLCPYNRTRIHCVAGACSLIKNKTLTGCIQIAGGSLSTYVYLLCELLYVKPPCIGNKKGKKCKIPSLQDFCKYVPEFRDKFHVDLPASASASIQPAPRPAARSAPPPPAAVAVRKPVEAKGSANRAAPAVTEALLHEGVQTRRSRQAPAAAVLARTIQASRGPKRAVVSSSDTDAEHDTAPPASSTRSRSRDRASGRQ